MQLVKTGELKIIAIHNETLLLSTTQYIFYHTRTYSQLITFSD